VGVQREAQRISRGVERHGASYLLGPHLSEGLGRVATLFGEISPGADIRDAVDYSHKAAHPGSVAEMLENFLLSAASAGDIALPGKVLAPLVAGIFGGRRAFTANRKALQKAEQMAGSGATPEQIYARTGWFQGADGQWRFEIDDSSAAIKDRTADRSRGLFDHPALYRAYPFLSNARVEALPSQSGANGAFDASTNTLYVSPDSPVGEGTLLHEFQHGVQDFEDFALGSNPLDAVYDAQLKPLFHEDVDRRLAAGASKGDALTAAALDLYHRSAGEVEARAVSARRALTKPDRRQSFPPEAYDVPVDRQIVRR
jgi:hypothetical protein